MGKGGADWTYTPVAHISAQRYSVSRRAPENGARPYPPEATESSHAALENGANNFDESLSYRRVLDSPYYEAYHLEATESSHAAPENGANVVYENARFGALYSRTRPYRRQATESSHAVEYPVEFGGNVTSTTDAQDGSQFPPDSSASQPQNSAGPSVVVEEVPRLPGQATELAKLGLPTPDSVVVKEVPSLPGETTELAAKSGLLTRAEVRMHERIFPGQATELATSGVPIPDSEALGSLNEGSEKALDVQLQEAFLHGYRRDDPERAAEVSHGVTQVFGGLLRLVRSLDYNLRRKLCEHILPNGEKAGKSSSKGNLAESSDAPYAKRTKQADPNLVGSKEFTGVQQRNKSFVSRIRLPGTGINIWLGTYKTKEAAARAKKAADKWLATHSGSKLLTKEERDDMKKCARKAGEHLSDDHSHHNVASPDLVENLEEKATTLASLKGNAVASAEHVSRGESPAHENPFSPSKFLDLESLGLEFFVGSKEV